MTDDAKAMAFLQRGEDGLPTGRMVAFRGAELRPLQYTDLLNIKSGDKIAVPLDFRNGEVAYSDFPELVVGSCWSGTSTLVSTHTSKAIGLVKGGWLPPGLANDGNLVVLPDRCTISDLKGRFSNGIKIRADDKDFLDFLAEPDIQINPLFHALEGNQKKNPTSELVVQQLNEAVETFRSILPNAKVLGADASDRISGIALDTEEAMSAKENFLMRIASNLAPPTSARNRDRLWNEVLSTADDCGVPRVSLVVFAALSSITVPNGRSPAKRLLKLKSSYSSADAYNALADLRSLEILMSLFGLFPDQKLMLCTSDRDMALFWVGLRASDFDWTGEHPKFNLSPVDDLLPSITPAQWASVVGTPASKLNLL